MFRLGIALLLCVACVNQAANAQCTTRLCNQIRSDLAVEWNNIEPGSSMETEAALLRCLDALQQSTDPRKSRRDTNEASWVQLASGAPSSESDYKLANAVHLDLIDALESSVQGGIDRNNSSLLRMNMARAKDRINESWATHREGLQKVSDLHCDGKCANPGLALSVLLSIPAGEVRRYSDAEQAELNAEGERKTMKRAYEDKKKAYEQKIASFKAAAPELIENTPDVGEILKHFSDAVTKLQEQLKKSTAGLKTASSATQDTVTHAQKKHMEAAERETREAENKLTELKTQIEALKMQIEKGGTAPETVAQQLKEAPVQKQRPVQSDVQDAINQARKTAKSVSDLVDAAGLLPDLVMSAQAYQQACNKVKEAAADIRKKRCPARQAAGDIELYRICFNLDSAELFQIVRNPR
jgi:hypothetical protein